MKTTKNKLLAIFLALLSASAVTYAAENDPDVGSSLRGEQDRISDVKQEAEALLANGKDKDAITVYENFLKEYPRASEAMIDLAEIYSKSDSKEDYKKGIDWSQKAININPKEYRAYITLADNSKYLGQWDAAREGYLHAYTLTKEKKDIEGLMVTSCLLSDYYDGSEESDQETIKWSDECIDHLPEVLVNGEGLPTDMPTAGQLQSAFEDATINKADAYVNLKEYDKATHILEKYLKMYPDSDAVKEALKVVKEKSKK